MDIGVKSEADFGQTYQVRALSVETLASSQPHSGHPKAWKSALAQQYD